MSDVYYEGSCLVIDLHGLLAEEAELLLEQQIDHLPPSVLEVRVIHGFHRGSALLDLVRKGFRHRRIAGKRIGLNKGVTTFVLK